MGIKRPFGKSQVVMPRPPALCQGCGHRDVYDALNKVAAEYPDARIFGDIGCYTLGALPPFRAIDSCVIIIRLPIQMGIRIIKTNSQDLGKFHAFTYICLASHTEITRILK